MASSRLFSSPLKLPNQSCRLLCKTWLTCISAQRHTWRQRCDSLLASGHALSVVPLTIRQRLDLVVKPAPGWKGEIPTSFGVPCNIGRITIWLLLSELAGAFRELSVLALLPKHEQNDAPPFIHLGAQFLVEHRLIVHADFSTGNPLEVTGSLVFPDQ